jgi:hypothetical protein
MQSKNNNKLKIKDKIDKQDINQTHIHTTNSVFVVSSIHGVGSVQQYFGSWTWIRSNDIKGQGVVKKQESKNFFVDLTIYLGLSIEK